MMDSYNKKIHEDLQQMLEGDLDELKGELLKAAGHHAKGDMEILKGEVKYNTANADISLQDLNKSIEEHIDKAKNKLKNDIQSALS